MILELNNVSVGYQEPLISEVNASVSEGELVLLVGKNGVGKSTLLNAIKGMHKLDSGEVVLQSKAVSDYSVHQLSQLIAVVNTSRPLLNSWSVRDVLKSTHHSRNGSESQINQAIRLCRIEKLAEKQIDNLSDGEFQKVMIARAICQQTPIIILDEPTSFLDVIYREHVLEIFSELKNTFGTTLVLSSHNFAPLLKIASQVWLVNRGRMSVSKSDFDYDKIIQNLK